MKPSKAKNTGQNDEIRAINNVKKLQDMCIELSSTRDQLESTARTLKTLYRKEQAKYDKAKCELSNIKAKLPLIDFYRTQLLNYSKDINTIMKTQIKTNMSIEEYKAAISRKNKKVSEIFQQQEMFLQSMSRIQSFDDELPTTEYAKQIEGEINLLKTSGKFKASSPDVIKTLQEEKCDFEKQYKECKAQLDLVTKENNLLRQINERNATQKLEKQLKQQQELNSKLLDENGKLRQQKTDLQQQLSETLSKLLKITSPSSKNHSGIKQSSRKSEDNKSMASFASSKSQASTVSKSGKKMVLRPKGDYKSPRTPSKSTHVTSPEKDDKATIADLKKQLAAANAKIKELTADQEKNKSDLIEQENRTKELRSTFAAKREEYNRELEIRSQDKAKMVERISQFETQIKEIGKEINRLRQANADGKQRIATIEKKIEEGTAKIQTKKSKWEKQNAEQEEVIARKEAELARINEQLSPIQKPTSPVKKPQKSILNHPSLVDFKDSDGDENGDDFKEMQASLVISPTKGKAKPLPEINLSSSSDDFSDLKPTISVKQTPLKLESPQQNNKPMPQLPESDSSDDFSDLKPSKPQNSPQILHLKESSSDDFSDLRPAQKASPAILQLEKPTMKTHDSLASFVDDGSAGDDFSDMEIADPGKPHRASFVEGENEFADLPTSHSTATLQLPSSAFEADDGGIEMTDCSSRPPSVKRRPPSIPISESGSMEFERPKAQRKPSILSIPDARMMSARSEEFADSETPVHGSSKGELRDFEDDSEDDMVIGYNPPERPEQPALLKLADTTPDIGTIFDDDDSIGAPLMLRPQRSGYSLTMTQPMRRRESQASVGSDLNASGPVTPKVKRLDPDMFADLDDDDDMFGKPIEEPRTADGHIMISFDESSWFDFQKMERHLARHNAIMNGVGLPEPMTPRDNESIASIINDIPDSKLF